MAEPIYKFFMGRFLEPWYQLSKEEQDSLQAKLRDAKKNSAAHNQLYATQVGPRINGRLLDTRCSRTSKRSRSTWRPFRSSTGSDTATV